MTKILKNRLKWKKAEVLWGISGSCPQSLTKVTLSTEEAVSDSVRNLKT